MKKRIITFFEGNMSPNILSYSSKLFFLSLHFILLFAIFKFLYQIETSIDLHMFDETTRLTNALAMSFSNGGEFALYELWYSFLNLFISDPIQLYTFNYSILVTLSVIFIYAYIAQKRGYDLVTLWLPLIFLVSILVYKLWPFTHLFGLLLILFVLLAVDKISKKDYQWLLFSICAIAMLYIRVEYMVLLGIISLGLLFQLFQEVFRKNKRGMAFYSILVFVCILFLSYGNPATRGGNRSLSAFLAHYAKTLSLLELKIVKGEMPSTAESKSVKSLKMKLLTPILDDDYHTLKDKGVFAYPWSVGESFYYKKFGYKTSVYKIFFEYPLDFIRHMLRNVFMFILLVPHSLLSSVPGSRLFFVPLYLFICALCIIAYRKKLWKLKFKKDFLSFFSNPRMVFIIGIFVSSIISLIVIHPRRGYFILPIGLGIALLGRGLPALQKLIFIPKLGIVFLCMLTIYFAPYRSTTQIGLLPSLAIKGQLDECSYRSRFHFIRNIPWYRKHVNFASSLGQEVVYLNYKGRYFQHVYFSVNRDITKGFFGFLKKNNLDIIECKDACINFFKSKTALEYYDVKKNVGFANFIKNPRRYGFAKMYDDKCSDIYYFVRSASYGKK